MKLSLVCALIGACTCVSSKRFYSLRNESEADLFYVGGSSQVQVRVSNPVVVANNLYYTVVKSSSRTQGWEIDSALADRSPIQEGYTFQATEEVEVTLPGTSASVKRIAFYSPGKKPIKGWLSVAEPDANGFWTAILNQVTPPPAQQRYYYEVVTSKRRHESLIPNSNRIDKKGIPRGTFLSALQVSAVRVNGQRVARVQSEYGGRVGLLSVVEEGTTGVEVLRNVRYETVPITLHSLKPEKVLADGYSQLAAKKYPADEWTVIDVIAPLAHSSRRNIKSFFLVTPLNELASRRKPAPFDPTRDGHPEIHEAAGMMFDAATLPGGAAPKLEHKPPPNMSTPILMKPPNANTSICYRVIGNICDENHDQVCADSYKKSQIWHPGSCAENGFLYCFCIGVKLVETNWQPKQCAQTEEIACEILRNIALDAEDVYQLPCGGKTEQSSIRSTIFGDECIDRFHSAWIQSLEPLRDRFHKFESARV